jgi:hypothetical protein
MAIFLLHYHMYYDTLYYYILTCSYVIHITRNRFFSFTFSSHLNLLFWFYSACLFTSLLIDMFHFLILFYLLNLFPPSYTMMKHLTFTKIFYFLLTSAYSCIPPTYLLDGADAFPTFLLSSDAFHSYLSHLSLLISYFSYLSSYYFLLHSIYFSMTIYFSYFCSFLHISTMSSSCYFSNPNPNPNLSHLEPQPQPQSLFLLPCSISLDISTTVSITQPVPTSRLPELVSPSHAPSTWAKSTSSHHPWLQIG